MAKKSKKKKQIKLVSSLGTGVFYVTTITGETTGKLALRKYDKKARKHCIFNQKDVNK